MSFGSKRLDDAYDRYVTTNPIENIPLCKKCGEQHQEDEECENESSNNK